MNRQLKALSVGAGDGRHLTIEGKEILQNCDVLYYPVAKIGQESIALSGIKKHLNSKTILKELLFPMSKEDLTDYWEKNAKVIDQSLEENKCAVFITIGDVMNFSTFAYLKERLNKDIKVSYIPGVPAYNVAAASLEKNLGLGESGFAVLPGVQSLEYFIKTLELFDTIAVLKPNKSTLEILKEAQINHKFQVHRVTNCGFDNTIIAHDIELKELVLPYMTVLLIEKDKL